MKLLPWIGWCLNSMESHNSGLNRFQLLFSPFISEYAVAWGDFDFGIQQQAYKKVLKDRQRILDKRQKLHSNTAYKFPVGSLVFRTNEKKPKVSNPKLLPPYTELYMVVGNKGGQAGKSQEFRLHVQNLRTNKIVAVAPPMLKKLLSVT